MVSPKTISVTLSLGSEAHHASLPEMFAQRGMLRRAVRFGKDLDILAPDGDAVKVIHRFASFRLGTRLVWGTWRRLPTFARSTVPMVLWSGITDRMISRWIPPCDVFHGMAVSSLVSLRYAKRLGASTIVDSPFRHPASWQRDVARDCATVGLDPKRCERFMTPLMIRRLMQQYELCDRIIVYSSEAQRSFEPFPCSSKAVVVRPGIDHHVFAPIRSSRTDSTFRACYVGRIEAPKGVAYLLWTWKRLALADAELLLVGRDFPEIHSILQDAPPNVRLTGFLSMEGVAKCLAQSNIFVFPSANEAMSLALLQAMSAGIPVIACQDTPAQDCITPGQNGILVPARNTEALADAILWCYRNRDALALMGQAARTRIEQEFTLSHYVQRLIALYESIVS